MKGSHPPSLITLARRALREECGLARGDMVLVAVSGGPDSMALLHVLARLAPSLGLRVAAHGVDHGLRAAAAAELELASRLAAALDVPFATTRVEVGHGANLMARARVARFEALRAAARAAGASAIATGHHADDRAETVLLRILRGAGPAGLAVLPPRADDLVRPFVRARRRDVEAHVARHALVVARDPTNLDARHLRTRVRTEVLPMLTALSPRIVESLCALADQLAAAAPAAPADPLASGLGRAQRRALERALALGQGRARVPVAGGKTLGVDLARRRIVSIEGS